MEVTKRLAEAGKVLGIELLDHLVVCDEKYVSLKEKGQGEKRWIELLNCLWTT